MNETEYLDGLITDGKLVTIRLAEGRELSAVPVAHDATAIILKNPRTGGTSLVYKRAVSVITPAGG